MLITSDDIEREISARKLRMIRGQDKTGHWIYKVPSNLYPWDASEIESIQKLADDLGIKITDRLVKPNFAEYKGNPSLIVRFYS